MSVRSASYVPQAATWGLGGIGIAAAAPLFGMGEWAGWIGGGGVVVAGAVGVLGHRGQQRQELHLSLEEGLAPLIGGRSTVVTRGWKGWPGTPTRVIIRYDAVAKDGDPNWKAAVVDATQRRLDVSATITKHDRRGRRVVLTTRDVTKENPVEQRVSRTIGDLLGSGARVTSFKSGADGDVASFEVRHIPTTKVASSGGYRAKVERTFGHVHQGRWRCKWDLEHDKVLFELRPPFPEVVELPRAQVDTKRDVLASYDKVSIDFGVDEDGNKLSWRPAVDPNLMVVGAPGTGKTVLEHNILASVAQWGWPIWVVDGKAIEFLGWRTWPNVQTVASTVETQVAVISRAHEVMEHRYQLIVAGRASEDDFEPLMLFIDEWSDFRANLTDWYTTVKAKGMPTKAPVLQKVASIARKGRSSRVHLLFATQRPDAEYFGGDMRDNFRCRISMGRLSPQGAMMMYQDPNIGTTVPRGRRGRATTIDENNRPVETQTYFVPDPRKANRRGDQSQLDILEGLMPDEMMRRHGRLIIVPPSDDDIDKAGSDYTAWCTADWVPAEARPDLDPVTNTAVDAQQAREMASPMAMFGIPSTTARPASDTVDIDDLDDVLNTTQDTDDGYGLNVDADPLGLSIGDLVELEPGYWVTVDEEPEEDPLDPSLVLLCWRDDEDNTGATGITLGERVTSRRALIEEGAL